MNGADAITDWDPIADTCTKITIRGSILLVGFSLQGTSQRIRYCLDAWEQRVVCCYARSAAFKLVDTKK